MTEQTNTLEVLVWTDDGVKTCHTIRLPDEHGAMLNASTSLIKMVNDYMANGESLQLLYPSVTYNRHHIVRVEFRFNNLQVAEELANEQVSQFGFPTGGSSP